MPRVSVVTGYYNRAEYLERTISSILDQTYHNIELIVFDDCSTDGTSNLLREIAAQRNDTRLKIIIHEKNLGFVRGMINAIAHSEGEIIAVQGSGDVSLPTRIEKQLKLLDSDPDLVVVGCHYTNIVEGSGIRRPRFPNADDMTFDKLVAGGNNFSHGEVMYRKDTYIKAGGYRPAFKASQDSDLWLRMIKLGRFATVKENLYDRYVLFDGVSYVPKKVLGQMRYSLLARRIAKIAPPEATALLNELELNGPMKLVPNEDPELQKKIFKTAMRALAWGNESSARDVGVNLTAPHYRTALRFADLLLTGPVGPMVRPIFNKLAGIGSG